MELLEIFFFLITLLLMPFITHGKPWPLKLLYIGVCGFFTPIIGIPILPLSNEVEPLIRGKLSFIQ